MISKKHVKILLPILLALGLSSVAQADLDMKCTNQPRSEWLSKDKLVAVAEKMGYKVYKIEFDDRCAEIDGLDKNGAKIELKLNPATGEVVPYTAR